MPFNTSMAKRRAMSDYMKGEGRDSNPYIYGMDSHKTWQQEMDRLHDLEMDRLHAQGIAESQLAESLNG